MRGTRALRERTCRRPEQLAGGQPAAAAGRLELLLDLGLGGLEGTQVGELLGLGRPGDRQGAVGLRHQRVDASLGLARLVGEVSRACQLRGRLDPAALHLGGGEVEVALADLEVGLVHGEPVEQGGLGAPDGVDRGDPTGEVRRALGLQRHGQLGVGALGVGLAGDPTDQLIALGDPRLHRRDRAGGLVLLRLGERPGPAQRPCPGCGPRSAGPGPRRRRLGRPAARRGHPPARPRHAPPWPTRRGRRRPGS